MKKIKYDEIRESYIRNNLPNSFEYYMRAKKVLAGSSTFSKGPGQYAYGISPFSLHRGKGAYVWDVDGHKYIDYILGLGSNILGYGHKDFNAAVKKQLSKGVSFSLSNILEIEVAELLCEYIPGAELVRYGKNGNDVTSAAVRLARYITGREIILFGGYHGWQDWYAGKTSMNGGIPKRVQDLSIRFPFNDIQALQKVIAENKNKIACIIMEPIYKVMPEKKYLEAVRALCSKNNIILIFDEIISGFRCEKGSAQKYYGIKPDLSCFSKAIANGFPLSILTGKKELMKECNKIYFTMTNAGESISLAAAAFVLNLFLSENIAEKNIETGRILKKSFLELIVRHQLEERITLTGFDWRHIIQFNNYNDISSDYFRTLWIQETSKVGILNGGYHFISLAHNENIIKTTIERYDRIFAKLKKIQSLKDMKKNLECPISDISARGV